MATAVIAFVILGFIHFLYDGIILPSIRLRLRFGLFRLRDDLRALKLSKGEELPDEVFHYIQDSINNAINMLPRVDVVTAFRLTRLLDQDKEFARLLEERKALIENCSVEEAKQIHTKVRDVIPQALVVNNLMLLMYLVPIFILAVLGRHAWNALKDSVSAPENRVASFVSPALP